MEMQILDVDYVMVNDKPIIRIFGKMEDGKSVCSFYDGFLPYFYVKGNVDPIIDSVLKVEKVERVEISTNKPAGFNKVTISNPGKTPEMRNIMTSAGTEVLEADILFKYRFMNDLNLSGLGWMKMDGEEAVSTNTVSVDRTFSVKKIRPVNKDVDIPMKTMAFDIECVPAQEGEIPEAKSDPVIMLSMSFNPPYKGKESIVLATRVGKGVQICETEKELLEEFIRVVNEFDCDIITGFNCNNFDIPYVLERMENNGVRPVFGRCKSKRVMARKLGMRHRVTIAGRIVVDSFEIVKKDFSLQRYGLDFVASKLLGKEKDKVKHSEIKGLWEGNDEG